MAQNIALSLLTRPRDAGALVGRSAASPVDSIACILTSSVSASWQCTWKSIIRAAKPTGRILIEFHRLAEDREWTATDGQQERRRRRGSFANRFAH